jgi:5-methylcytosine-specific restriction endonuclease McrA
MGNKTIHCLLCDVKVAKDDLKDHIAGIHFNHARHKCQDCGDVFTTRNMALKHAGMTDHQVLINCVGAFDQGILKSS